MSKEIKHVLTFGTFDLLHYGHVNFLKRAAALGDTLTVGLSTDQFVFHKEKVPYFDYNHRKIILEAIKYVDFIVPETSFENEKEDALSGKYDILVMGDDYLGKFDYVKEIGMEVVYLPRTVPGETPISSREIKKKIKYNNKIKRTKKK